MKIYSDGLKCSLTDDLPGITFEISLSDEYKPILEGLGGVDKVILYDLLVSHNMLNFLDSSDSEAMTFYKVNKKGEVIEKEGWYFNNSECLTEEEIDRIKHNKQFNKTIVETIIKE